MNPVRTVSDTKQAFYQTFPKPVNSIYRRVVDELMVEMHLLTVNQTFVCDAIFALGLVTAFDRFTTGYRPARDREAIFHSLCQSVGFDAERFRQEATHLKELAMRSPADVANLLKTLEASVNLDPLMGLVRSVATNPQFKYSRLFGIGICTLLETTESETMADTEKRQELIATVGNTLKIANDRLSKDLDLYRSNLEKVEQARQMMADLAEAERKKREKRSSPKLDDPSESQENAATSA